MVPELPRNINDLLAVEDSGPNSLRERGLRLDTLLSVLVGICVEETRIDPPSHAHLRDALAYLALPCASSNLDFLEAYADYLAGERRPETGFPQVLQDLILLRGFTREPSRRVVTLGAGDEMTTVTTSIGLLRLSRALLPLLHGARPEHTGSRIDVPKTCIGAYEDIATGLGPIGSLRLARLASAAPAERRMRLTFVPLGGSLSQSSTALASWDPPPQVDDVVLLGAPLPAPIRISPRVVFRDDGLFLLGVRRTAWVYRPLVGTEGESPPADPAALAPWVFPVAVNPDDLPAMIDDEASRTGGVSIAIDDSVVSELMQGDLTAGRTLGDRFRLDREISRGIWSAVFEGHDMDTERAVILKVLRPRDGEEGQVQIESFAREAEVLESIDHPGVTRLVHNGSRETPGFLALDPFDGHALRSLMEPGVAMPIERAEPIMRGLCSCLTALHYVGIVHRDIKPENILVAADDAVQLIDFGLARTGAGEGIILDDVGGTLPYMSPEAIAGARIGPYTDVFAMGCLIYEMLTGKTLYGGRDAHDVEAKIGRGERGPAELIRDRRRGPLFAMIVAATAVDPVKRIPDGATLARMLDAALRGENPARVEGAPASGGFLSRLFRRS